MINLNRSSRQYNPDPGGNRQRDTAVYVGVVKDNADDQRMGRLLVWIPEFGGDPSERSSWITVGYASPFAGATSIRATRESDPTMDGSQKSYGMWMVPPDLENEVLVTFINGDVARGFWFACLWQQSMNHMVPGIPMNRTTDNPPGLAPVVEYNKRNDTINPEAPLRPSFIPLTNGLIQQGLTEDDERGPGSSGARREAPSQTFGVLSPRGNTIHIDDNPTNEFVRIRTRSGAQILVHETSGYVYINAKNGDAWVEVSDKGVDIYSKLSVSVRAEENINLRADKDIILNAGQNIHLRADAGDVTIDASANVLTKAGTNAATEAGGTITEKSVGNNTRDAAGIFDNTGQSPAVSTPAPKALVDIIGAAGAYSRSSKDVIVSRMPTHEPWPVHTATGGSAPVLNDADYRRIGGRSGQPVDQERTSVRASRTRTTGSGNQTVVDRNYEDNSPRSKVGRYNVSESVKSAIREGSAVSGVPVGYMAAMAETESGFNPNAKAKTSSATGLYQFTDGTWNQMVDKYGSQYGISREDRLDPRANAIMGGLYAKENQSFLQRQGHTVGNTDLYMAHFLGPGGADRFLDAKRANGNAPAYSAVSPSAAQANRSIFYRPDGTPRTVNEVYGNFENKIEPRAQQYEAQFQHPVG